MEIDQLLVNCKVTNIFKLLNIFPASGQWTKNDSKISHFPLQVLVPSYASKECIFLSKRHKYSNWQHVRYFKAKQAIFRLFSQYTR